MNILIIGALKVEIEYLINITNSVIIDRIFDLDLYKGIVGNNTIYTMQCSVGKVNAALCTQNAISKTNPILVINTGIAGSLKSINKIGTIVIGNEITYHDVRPQQMKNFFPFKESFYSDKTTVENIYRCATNLFNNITTSIGKIVTGDAFIDSNIMKEQIINKYHADCVEMESAAIAHTCYVNRIPFVCIRTICDNADESSIVDYEEFEEKSSIISSKLVHSYLLNI